MAQHRVASTDPLRMDAERFACNGQPVNPLAVMRIADGFNHIIGRRRKLLLCRAQDLTAVPGGSASASVWPLYFRTGEESDSILVYVGLSQSEYAATSPYLAINVYLASTGVAAVAQTNIYRNARVTGTTVQPNDIAHERVLISGLSSNTEYYASFIATDGLRPVYLTVIEGTDRYVDDANSMVCDPPSASSEAPILDGDVAKMVTASNGLWRHNGTPLLSWVADYDLAGAPSTVSASYTDLLTGTADSRRFAINAQYHTTLTRTTVPVKLAVKGTRTVGAGTGDVRLYDGTNEVAVTGMNSTGYDDWYAATGTIPAASTSTWAIQARATAGTTFLIRSVCLFPYEA